MLHARQVGELITAFGGQVSLGIGELLDRHYGQIDEMLEQMMLHEVEAIELYYNLMKLVENYDKPGSVMLDEFARTMILEEEQHLSEIEKMLRKRGEAFSSLFDN
jgi:bacterioferritin